MRSPRSRAAAALAVIFAAGIVFVQAAVPGEPPRVLLPDLRAVSPFEVEVVRADRGRFVLAFPSITENVGDGPLIVRASRPNRRKRRMRATQVIQHSDGTTSLQRRVGKLHFERNDDHAHWHFVRFMVYELRRASDGELVGPDVKTGFCLGDRGRITDRNVNGAERDRRFATNCGRNKPRRLRLTEGISVGWYDDYQAFLEGQYIDISGVEPGRYVLVHRSNPRERIRETSYANNASSALVEIRQADGAPPTAEILDRCHDSARCGQG